MNLGIRRPLVYDDFPRTPILDTANRANEGPPPSANWASGFFGFTQGLSVVSNEFKDPGVNPGSARWIATNFGPDCEVYATIRSLGGQFRLFARGKDPGIATFDGYGVRCGGSGSGTAEIYRFDNGVATQLGATITTDDNWAVGDTPGLRIVGSTITFFKRHNGIMREIASRTDATYGAAGFIGMMLGSAQTADNFGGGTI